MIVPFSLSESDLTSVPASCKIMTLSSVSSESAFEKTVSSKVCRLAD